MSKERITTFNGCYYTGIKVTPQNWNTKQSNTSADWKIYYEFFNIEGKKMRPEIKGMNVYKNKQTRIAITKQLIKDLQEDLEIRGYNPFLKDYMNEEYKEQPISPNTPFIEALEFAKSIKTNVVKSTVEDITFVINRTETISKKLRIDNIPISSIRKLHIKLILTEAGKVSAHNYNKFRCYLNILFSELIELDVTELNICGISKKQKTIKKIKGIISKKDRQRIDDHLKAENYNFWRFTNIFYYSGCRIEEMLSLKVSDVILDNQEFKILVKKGAYHKETIRPIQAAILPLWKELLEGAPKDGYVFSKFLAPGLADKPIRYEQIERRWRRWVKGPLGIKETFYQLKHTHEDEMEEMLGIEAAAKHSEHSVEVAKAHYTSGREKRQRDKVKNMTYSFT